jgi:S-adenosylmethionine decarboxylase
MQFKQNEYGFGPHLMVDGYHCNADKLADPDFIFETLDKFPDTIKMTKLMPPYVFKYQGQTPADSGVSGVVLIAESHITLHTFPDQQHFFVDIFSTKSFNAEAAAVYLAKLFEAGHHEVQILNRELLEVPHAAHTL